MRVFMTGASGFLGEAITAALLARGNAVVALSRSGKGPRGAEVLTGDPTQSGNWMSRVPECDAVVHLAGEPVGGKRWSDEYKQKIRDSRIQGTRMVVAAGPRLLICASGVDVYPFDESDREYDETSPPGGTFLAEVVRDWEAEALRAQDNGTRVVLMRIGVVIGPGGGALVKLIPIFKRFAGGPLGTGRQWVSWVHVDDVAGVTLSALDNPALRGPVNVVAASCKQAAFSKALGDALKRPSWLQVPALALKLAAGGLAEYLLHGRKVVPRALEKQGYKFRHAELPAAMAASV